MDYALGTVLAGCPAGLDVEIACDSCKSPGVFFEFLFAEGRAEIILTTFVRAPELSCVLVNYCKTDRVSRHRFTSIL